MSKKKNQDSEINKKEGENSLADIVRSTMIGKQQVQGILKNGNNFCISGLLINHFAPDIDIEYDSWSGIIKLVDRYPKYFSDEEYSMSSFYGHDALEKYVTDFKQYYKDTGSINLRILVSINDISFSTFKHFTFEDFANLFEEIGITIEKLEPDITKYKEDTVFSLDNIQLIEENKPSISTGPMFNPFSNTNTNIHIENMNVNLDPSVLNDLISKHVAEMLYNGKISRPEIRKPSKDIIKTEHKNV